MKRKQNEMVKKNCVFYERNEKIINSVSCKKKKYVKNPGIEEHVTNVAQEP